MELDDFWRIEGAIPTTHMATSDHVAVRGDMFFGKYVEAVNARPADSGMKLGAPQIDVRLVSSSGRAVTLGIGILQQPELVAASCIQQTGARINRLDPKFRYGFPRGLANQATLVRGQGDSHPGHMHRACPSFRPR
jgi:hypothetical protein